MRTSWTIVSGVTLLLTGYILGASGVLSPQALFAQADPAAKKADKAKAPAIELNLTDDVRAKIQAAATALNAAKDALTQENLYNSATKGVNAYAILTGGCNSMNDLESGRGVDPDTFAALYAGLAEDAIVSKLGRDPEDRLTYNGKLIRMYPITRLKGLNAVRAAITGEEVFAPPPEAESVPGKKGAKKKTDATDPQ